MISNLTQFLVIKPPSLENLSEWEFDTRLSLTGKEIKWFDKE